MARLIGRTLAVMTARALVVMLMLLYAPAASAQDFDYFFLEAMMQRQKGNSDAAFELLRCCLRLNPLSAETHFFLAQYYSAMKDEEQALDHVRQAVALSAQNSTYAETLAQMLISREEYAEATKVVERLYQSDRSRDELLELLFQLYQQQDDYKQAISVLERIEQNDGKSERLSIAKSEIYSRQGNNKAALAEIEALSKQYPNDMSYLALYADRLLMNGKDRQALSIYNRILSEEPNNSRVLLSLRNYHLSKQDTVEAGKFTDQILLNPDASTTDKIYVLRQEIGTSEAAAGDSTRILSLFRKTLDRHPNADIDILLAGYMGMKNMPRDSIARVLKDILALQPDNAAARLQLVSFLWDQDEMQQVTELCQAARQYNPDEMAFYYFQGVAYYRLEKLDEALSAFQNGIGVINEQSDDAIVSDFYAVMGDILHQKGRADEAFEAYENCLKWKEDNIGCLNNYAYYLSEKSMQLDKAEQMSYKTIKAEPKNATYLDTYAWILFMQQRYTEAAVYIEQALQNDDTESEVLLEHAGDIFANCGKMEQAMDYWQNAAKKTTNENNILARKIKLKKYIKQ